MERELPSRVNFLKNNILFINYLLKQTPYTWYMFFCLKTFKAEEGIKKSGIPFLDDYEGHPRVHSLMKA